VSAKKIATAQRKSIRRSPQLNPEILIFDVDGVLIDVRETFWLSALQTVREITGKGATWAQLYQWKSKPENNDDWRMVANWASSMGHPTSYEQARDAFQKYYWGEHGKPGNVAKERLLVSQKQFSKWASRRELNLFTGRTRKEFVYTFERMPAASLFRNVVTMDDVKKKKPSPEGLFKILGDRDPKSALYLGDNIDDALAARAAGVLFMAIVPPGSFDFRNRANQFRELGALAILNKVTDLNFFLTKR
jgi:HAD superfamily hydrolase (TIGR01548 family)